MKSYIVTILALAALTATAFSQVEPGGFSFGITAGYNSSLHNNEIQTVPGNLMMPTLSNGTANGYSLGLSFELPVTSAPWSLGIIGRIAYETLPAHGYAYGGSYPRLEFNETDSTYSVSNMSTEWSYDLNYNVISANFLFRANLFNSQFGVIAGPTFSYVLNNNYKQTYNIVEPVNAQFKRGNWDSLGLAHAPLRYENNDRRIVYEDGPLKGISNFIAGLSLGVQYEILLSDIKVVPFVSYNFGITELKSNWRVASFKAGIDARILF
jgi:hypothetical protein